jgi:hypothetical protein
LRKTPWERDIPKCRAVLGYCLRSLILRILRPNGIMQYEGMGFRVCVEHEGQTKQHIRQGTFLSPLPELEDPAWKSSLNGRFFGGF